jgi:hypothetical protein
VGKGSPWGSRPASVSMGTWGDTFEVTRCNCPRLGLGKTTPVGVFPDGAIPSVAWT